MTEHVTHEGNRRLRTSYFSVVLSVTLVLFMVGLLGILVLDARKIATYVKEHVQLTIFLNDGMTPDQLKDFRTSLENAPFTRSLRYVSKEQALDSLTRELGEDVNGLLESNPLPASFDIMMRAGYASADSLEVISNMLSMNEAFVQEVQFPRSEVDRIGRNFRSVALVLAILSAVLLLIAIALINHTIRLALFSSRFMIKSMQLVGANRSFIRRPFLVRSVINGLTAGAVASVLLFGVLYFIDLRFPDFGQLKDLRSVVLLICSTIGLGVLLSAASTYFVVNKYLALSPEELY
jgi:cell division transport system permease protein